MPIPIDVLQQNFSLLHPSDFKISQGFALNANSFYAELGMKGHNGIDYAANTASLVAAPCGMEVAVCYQNDPAKGYGTTVVARSDPFDYHGFTYRLEMVFGHLLDYYPEIKIGVRVQRGKIFATTDNTGKYTTGPHLHWGVRVVKKTMLSGWQVIDKDNGYAGYIDPAPFTHYEENIRLLEGKLVYAGKQNGARHYLAHNGILWYIADEVVLATAGLLFEEAEGINANLINSAEKRDLALDYTTRKTKEVKQLLGLLVGNPNRANELNKKYF